MFGGQNFYDGEREVDPERASTSAELANPDSSGVKLNEKLYFNVNNVKMTL